MELLLDIIRAFYLPLTIHYRFQKSLLIDCSSLATNGFSSLIAGNVLSQNLHLTVCIHEILTQATKADF